MNYQFGPLQITMAAAIYIFLGACLYTMAKKLNLANPWWGFVPILQILLMLNIAAVPLWWFFLFLIPLVNVVIAIMVWIKVAQRLNKPGWLGALMILPGIDIFVLGYLAFSK